MPTKTFFRLRDEKQEGLLRSAIHEFLEYGYERAKIGDIAKKAGVATGSVYQYFEDKKELYIYCARWGLEVFMKKLGKRVDLDKMDIYEYFHDSISKMDIIADERELVMFMQSISKEPGLMDDSMKAMYETGDTYIKTLIQSSKDKGTVRADIDDELLKEYFIAVTDRFRMRWAERYVDFTKEMTEEQNQAIQKELDQMLELLRKGMGNPSPCA